MIGFQQNLSLKGKTFGAQTCPLLIAEIGTNHNQDFTTARKLMESASEAGFDAVKFQIYEPYELTWEGFFKDKSTESDMLNTNLSQWDFSKLKTPKEWFPDLQVIGDELGLFVGVTVHGSDGLNWAHERGFDFLKIASMDHNNWPLLTQIREIEDTPILVSTGMATLASISSIAELFEGREGGFALMHCVSVYPHHYRSSRISTIRWLLRHFDCLVGFSDHTEGVTASVAAALLGSCVFEKHITTNRDHPGPDHRFAEEIVSAREYCDSVRWSFSAAYTMEVEALDENEIRSAQNYLRGVYVVRDIEAGETLQLKDIVSVRPPTSLTPNDIPALLGRRLERKLAVGDSLHPSAFLPR